MQGGLQASRALLRLAVKHGLWQGGHEDTNLDEVAEDESHPAALVTAGHEDREP